MTHDIRWLRVHVPHSFHVRARQVKARLDVTWVRMVHEAIELWLAKAEAETPDKSE